MKNQKPRIVSIFSGAGCFDLGFEKAGFDVLVGIDSDKDCCATLTRNKNWTVINSPIELIKPAQILKISNLRKKELELLVGAPPCQPFSKSAYGVLGLRKGLNDERAKTINEFFRMLEAFLPKVFVIENVPQFISGKNKAVLDLIQKRISKINNKNLTNYNFICCKINTAWFGVPQLRERIFIIGSRNGKEFKMPYMRFYESGDYELDLQPFRSAWDAIGHVKNIHNPKENLEVGGKWGHLLKSIPPGSNYLWHTEKGGGKNLFEWRSRYWNFLLKLNPALPSWTITAHPGQHTGPFHWDNRKLSIKEPNRT